MHLSSVLKSELGQIPVESGYLAHELNEITVKQYVLHNQVRQIARVEG